MKAIRLKEKGKEPRVFNTNNELSEYLNIHSSKTSIIIKIMDEYHRICKKYNIENIDYTDDFVMPQEYIDQGYRQIQYAGRLMYAANQEGEIVCVVNGKKMKYQATPDGYNIVVLNGKRYTVHRIIASLFVPNPNNLPMVNHINEDKTDNRACNLEWCDNKYNTSYGMFKEKCKSDGKPIPIRATKDGKEYFFNSINEASRYTGADKKSIRHCIRKNIRKTSKGFSFYLLE